VTSEIEVLAKEWQLARRVCVDRTDQEVAIEVAVRALALLEEGEPQRDEKGLLGPTDRLMVARRTFAEGLADYSWLLFRFATERPEAHRIREEDDKALAELAHLSRLLQDLREEARRLKAEVIRLEAFATERGIDLDKVPAAIDWTNTMLVDEPPRFQFVYREPVRRRLRQRLARWSAKLKSGRRTSG
jgi:hypothetical protein